MFKQTFDCVLQEINFIYAIAKKRSSCVAIFVTF